MDKRKEANCGQLEIDKNWNEIQEEKDMPSKS
jgi:hypothetical protein